MVVLLISIGTLINMASGPNGTILYFSEHYKMGVVLFIGLAVLVFALQVILIPMTGINGAAAATALSAVIYNAALSYFIWMKFRLQPFGTKNILTAGLILSCFLISYLLPVLNGPLVNMIFRSTVISGLFLLATYFLNIVPEFHSLLPFHKKRHTG